MRHVIVSRHPAAIEFIRQSSPDFAEAESMAIATPANVAGAVVAGNLPLHLAALAARVVAVEFSGQAPRGQEYGLEEMRAAGAHLRSYVVAHAAPPCPTIPRIPTAPAGTRVERVVSDYYGSHAERGYGDIEIVLAVPDGEKVPALSHGSGCAISYNAGRLTSGTYVLDDGAWKKATELECELSGEVPGGATPILIE